MRNQVRTTRLLDNQAIGWLIESVSVPVLLFIYWILVWQLERLDYLANPPAIVQPILLQLGIQPTLQRVAAFIMELFSWRVLRHFVPVILALYLARRAVIGFVWSFYGLPRLSEAGTFLAGLRQSETAGGPRVSLKRDDFDSLKEKHPLLRVGGPGSLTVGESDVVVTERNGRFHRVLGPGRKRLGRLEYVHSVLDLRQQERSQNQVPLVTQDGIEVRVDVSVTFRLRPYDEDEREAPAPTPDVPYPYGERAAERAAYAELVLEDGTIATWEDRPMAITISTLRRIVGQNPMDMLIYPELTVPGGRTHEPHRMLRKRTREQAEETLRDMGIQLLEVKLGRLETTQEVTRQRIRRWRANWDRQVLLGVAEGEAVAVREVALARAEAEAVMLRAIVEGLEDAENGIRGDKTQHEIVALRLIGALERMARDEGPGAVDADQILNRIKQMQREILRAPRLIDGPDSEEQNDS